MTDGRVRCRNKKCPMSVDGECVYLVVSREPAICFDEEGKCLPFTYSHLIEKLRSGGVR